ncbi:hypothetical protein DBR11_20970 [Pedobacter sp. HMWF019]|nr:hypothetical protein DBR11_20970 [Pedobacter sp. HMWF019]
MVNDSICDNKRIVFKTQKVTLPLGTKLCDLPCFRFLPKVRKNHYAAEYPLIQEHDCQILVILIFISSVTKGIVIWSKALNAFYKFFDVTASLRLGYFISLFSINYENI